MNPTSTISRIHRLLAASLLAAAPAVAQAGDAAAGVTATPYGAPSECAPGSSQILGLYCQRPTAAGVTLRLEGGRPGQLAVLCLGGERVATGLPGGGTLLVGGATARHVGTFDADGAFTVAVDGALEAAAGALFAQGLAPLADGAGGVEFSGGIELQRAPAPQPVDPTDPAAAPLGLPAILVEEFVAQLDLGNLEAALDLALNSDGDALKLDVGGNLELPVPPVPGLTLGGKVKFAVGITRGQSAAGAVWYDVAVGGDVAACGGYGVGVAGISASGGYGGEVIARYTSAHEVARAVRAMAILAGVPDGLELTCQILDGNLGRIDAALTQVHRALDRARRAARSLAPWRRNGVVQRLWAARDRALQQRRAVAAQSRAALSALVAWVATERTFLDDHVFALEVRRTGSIGVSADTGFGDAKQGGEYTFANLGLAAAAGVEVASVGRVELRDGRAQAFEYRYENVGSVAASAGLRLGANASMARTVQIVVRRERTGSGWDESVVVRLTLDGSAHLALGILVAGQAGVGGEVGLEVDLEDLRDYGADAMNILVAGSDDALAQLLRAVPVRLFAQGRYEAGIFAGFGVSVDGAFKFGLGMNAMMIDRGQTFEYAGGTSDRVAVELRGNGDGGRFAALRDRLHDVQAEVARVLAR